MGTFVSKCVHCGERIVNVAYVWTTPGWYHQSQNDYDNRGHDQGLYLFCHVTQAEPETETSQSTQSSRLSRNDAIRRALATESFAQDMLDQGGVRNPDGTFDEVLPNEMRSGDLPDLEVIPKPDDDSDDPPLIGAPVR